MSFSPYKKSIHKIYKDIFEDKFIRNVSIVSGGAIFAQLFSILFSPILTRIYTPEHYGLSGVFSAIYGVVFVVVSLRYEYAITLPESDDDAIQIMFLAIMCVVVVTGVISVLIIFFGEQILQLLKTEQLNPFLWFLPCAIFLSGIYRILNYWYIRQNSYRPISISKVNQGTFGTLTRFGLGLLRLKPDGLFWGTIVGEMVGLFTLLYSFSHHVKVYIYNISFKKIFQLAKKYQKYPFISTWAGLLNSLNSTLPPLLIAQYFDTRVVGQYGLATRVMGLPLALIGTAIGQVFFGEYSNYLINDPDKLWSFFWETIKKLVFMGGLVLVIGLVSPFLFSPIFGQQWKEAGYFAIILMPMYFLQFVVSPITTVPMILQKQGLQLLLDITRGLVIVILFAVGYLLQMNFYTSILIYSLGMLVIYIITFWICAVLTKNHHLLKA